MSWLTEIGDRIAEKLIPIAEQRGAQLLAYAEAEAQKLLARVVDTLAGEIQKQMPAITKALVVAVTQAGANAVVRAEDKVTDLIPGPVDDAILDPIVANAMDIFTGIIRGR